MESHLYSLGCLNPDCAVYDCEGPSNTDCLVKLCRLDLKCLDASWKTLPSKTVPNRCDPSLRPFGSKLYVLGSFLDSIFPQKAAIKGLGCTKVFDPISDTWESLPNLPFAFGFSTLFFSCHLHCYRFQKTHSCSSY